MAENACHCHRGQAGTLLAAFPRHLRDEPLKVRELLERTLPADLYDPERMKAEQVYRAMRDEWQKLDGLRWSELRGLFVAPFPAYMIPPWQSRLEIERRELPRDIPPDSAPVKRLPDGRVLYSRPEEPPLILEPDDGGLIRA